MRHQEVLKSIYMNLEMFMSNNLLKQGERIDDLQYKGFKIIQNPNEFCFGVDAVLLTNFSTVKKGNIVLDFGSGTGIIPILIAAKTQAKHITGVEIQPYLADMASRSVILNNISDKVTIINKDLKNASQYLKLSSFDIITCNPPYKHSGSGIINPDDNKALARHEIACNLEDIISQAEKLLKFGGKLCMIHRPHRLADIICLMRNYKIEPKRLRFVHSNQNKPSCMVLIEGSRSGGAELKVLKPLVIFDEYGNYSKEIDEIYDRGE